MPVDLFDLNLKNSVIAEYEATEEGREYLEKCERLKVTKVDRTALDRFKKKRQKKAVE